MSSVVLAIELGLLFWLMKLVAIRTHAAVAPSVRAILLNLGVVMRCQSEGVAL